MRSENVEMSGRTLSGSKAILHELAMKNVKKNARDYQIYFLTLTLAVALFYTFNSIEAQFAALGIPDSLSYLSFSAGMMAGVSVFICLIMGFLVVYANRFMLKRRQKEMGIYMTLGMEQKDIGTLLWRETCVIGGASLAAGLVLGVVLSQGLSLITAKIIGAGVENYHFVLSSRAIITSILFFGFMFLVVYRRNVREVNKMQLIDLINAHKKNEKSYGGKVRDILLFIVAVALLAAGCAVVFWGTNIQFFRWLFVGIGLMMAGTLLFCISVAGFYVKLCKGNKNYYYRRLNIFVVNQLGSRLKAAGLSIGVVSMLICLSITTMALGLGIGKYIIKGVERMAPYDISMRMEASEAGGNPEGATVGQILSDRGFDLSEYVGASVSFNIYQAEGILSTIFGSTTFDFDGTNKPYPLTILGVDDYNRLLELQGIDPIALEEGHFTINYNGDENEERVKNYVSTSDGRLDFNGTTLTLSGQPYHDNVYFDNNYLSDCTLIVPQSVAETLTVDWLAMCGTFQNEDSYNALRDAYLNSPMIFSYTTGTDILVEMTSTNLTFTYIGVYLGITFLIIAGAVLALQQLSQSADNEQRYDLLRRLGTKEKDMKTSLWMQLKVYFGLPFILALVCSGFIIGGSYVNIPYMSVWTITQTVVFAAGLVTVVFALYFMVTYMGSRRILKLR